MFENKELTYWQKVKIGFQFNCRFIIIKNSYKNKFLDILSSFKSLFFGLVESIISPILLLLDFLYRILVFVFNPLILILGPFHVAFTKIDEDKVKQLNKYYKIKLKV